MLITGAAACGIYHWRSSHDGVDRLGLVALVLFVAAMLAEGYLWREHPERAWYDGRALAESVKTLSWKYAVGGDPFPTMEANPQSVFVHRLVELKSRYPKLDLAAVSGEYLTPWMSNLRVESLAIRRQTYIEHRALDQQTWYEAKAKENKQRARVWKSILLLLELSGAVLALVESLNYLDLFFTPTVAAGTGAIVAWLETRQHDQLARAYSTTVSDLAAALTKLRAATSETDWAVEMNDAEDAISREHTLWLASRSQA